MNSRKDAFNAIVGSVSAEEASVVDHLTKEAVAVPKEVPGGLATKTENMQVKTLKQEYPSIGLSSLKYAGKGAVVTDSVNEVSDVAPAPHQSAEEDITVSKMPVDSTSVLQKRAMIEGQLSEALGMDLSKVATEEGQENFLTKMAEEVLSDSEADLEKTAILLAETMADAFISRVRG